MQFLSTEQTFTSRYPTTANLMIDSQDGTPTVSVATSMSNFSIRRSNALLNGFFTRVGVTELVLNWNEPNISVDLSNNFFTVIKTAGSVSYSVTLPEGTYTVAQALDEIVVQLNAAGTGLTWSVSGLGAGCSLDATGAYTVGATALASALGIFGAPSATSQFLVGPNLQPVKYLDFVSDNLTYNQSLKDASTAQFEHNVLARWYFAWDNDPNLDEYGFPILMGYTCFAARRTFNPPKQIRWMPDQSIGNLSFQVYANGQSSPYTQSVLVSQLSNWLMTLQVSEV